MLDFIQQKASHLWTAFYKSVYFLWLCIGIYALCSWGLWIGLQQSYKIIIFMSFLWIGFFVLMIISMYDAYIGKDFEEYSSMKPGFIGSAILFSILIAMNGFGILVFPVVMPVLPLGIAFSPKLKGSYTANIYNEYNLVWKVTSNVKRDEYDTQVAFVTFLVFYFFASFVILFVGACFSLGNFTNMVVLGAISNAIIILISAWALHDIKMKCDPVRDTLGGIPNNTMRKLERLYPEGVNTDRIKFLLHDTLKQEVPINLRFGIYGTIYTLLKIFPRVLYIADDEGNIPFRLACQYSSVEVVKYMIELDNELLNIRDSRGNTVMHYACQGNNYKVVNYLLNRYMILAVTRNFDGNLPVYILCSSELVHTCCPPPIHPHRLFVDSGARIYSNYGKVAPNPQHLETVMRLMLAYPDDMQLDKFETDSPSKEKVQVLSTPALMELAGSTGDDPTPIKPQKHLKLLVYIILVVVNMIGAVYIGTLKTLSNTNQMKYESEVKRLVDELIASQNEMNLLRSRMEALTLKHDSMLKVI